jgi:hypothetical protein
MRRADMFEHADGHDPVETAGEAAIVDQFIFDLSCDACRFGPLAGDLELFLRQGDTKHLDPGDAVEIKRHAAPAAADVEHALPGFQVELGGNMRLLVGLRLFQAVGGVGVIGATVLAVRVEEEVVQVVAEVIVVGDVFVGLGGGVAAEQCGDLAHPALRHEFATLAAKLPAIGADDQLEQVEDAAVLDDQPTIHIGLAEREPRVADDFEGEPAIGEANGDRLGVGIGAEALALAVGGDQRHPPRFDERAKQFTDQ